MKMKMNKIGNIIGNVVMYIFLAICIFAIILTVFSEKDVDGASEIFGYQMRVVTSDSMGKSEYTDVSGYKIKSIPINSMVFVKMLPEDAVEKEEWYDGIEIGDVITFRYLYSSQVTITHRVVDKVENGEGGWIFYLEGDNKNSDSDLLKQVINTSETNSPNFIIGEVVGQNYLFGLFLSILKKPIGTICLVIIPCFIIILLEVLRIVGVVNADKKKREQDEMAKKDEELEALRRKLAELEANKGTNAAVSHKEEE